MNKNLSEIIDQLTFAPIEKKGEILSILLSEGCVKDTSMSSFFGRLVIRVTVAVIGKEKVKESFQRIYLKNPKQTEEIFLSLMDVIIAKEPLPLIQDLLNAIYLAKWKFDPEDIRRYIVGK